MATTDMNTEKTKVSQDFVYEYLQKRGLKMSVIAEEMGVSVNLVTCCFKHTADTKGQPRSFTSRALPKLNAALGRIAERVDALRMPFGTDESRTETSTWKRTYDKALLDQLEPVGEMFKMNVLLAHILGWKESRTKNTLSHKTSGAYGHITQQDCDRINVGLSEIAGTLERWEVVATEAPAK